MVELVLARDNGKTLVLVPRDNFEWMSEDSIINEAGYFHEVKVSIAMIFIHYWINLPDCRISFPCVLQVIPIDTFIGAIKHAFELKEEEAAMEL
jgi:hypothetical protein